MFGEIYGNGIEFKYKTVDEEAAYHHHHHHHAPPPSPPPPLQQRSHFAQQGIEAGYMAPVTGRIHEDVQNPHLMRELFQIQMERERIRPEYQNPHLMRELFQIQMERERIKQEFIASELALRRQLEAEVRAEMMMLERKLTRQDRAYNVFNRFSLLPATGTRSWSNDLHFEQIERLSLLERLGIDSRQKTGGHKIHYEEWIPEHKMGPGPEIMPFQRRTFERKIDVATLTSETRPEQHTFLAKRKSSTPPREGITELSLNGVLKKGVKGKWSCETCNISVTSECGLHDHFQGKKHKAKEAASQRICKFSIGIQQKKTAKYTLLGATSDTSNKEQREKSVVQLLDSKEAGEVSLQKVKEVPPGVVILKNGQEAGFQPKTSKERFTFWCEMCQVGAFSETVIEAHRRGKKHVLRLEEARKHTTVPYL